MSDYKKIIFIFEKKIRYFIKSIVIIQINTLQDILSLN